MQSQEPRNIRRGTRNLLTLLIMIEFLLVNHMLVLHKILTNFKVAIYCPVMICHPLCPWWGSLLGTLLVHLFCLDHTISGLSIAIINLLPTQIPPTTLNLEILITCQSPCLLTGCLRPFPSGTETYGQRKYGFWAPLHLGDTDEMLSGLLCPLIWWKNSGGLQFFSK